MRRDLSACAFLCLVAGCGGGGDSQTPAAADAADAQSAQAGALAEPTHFSTDSAEIKAEQDAWVQKAAGDPKDPMNHFALAAQDAGGIDALNRLLSASDLTELRQVLGKRGIDVTDLRAGGTSEHPKAASVKAEALPAPLDSSQCIPFYSKAESDKTYVYPTAYGETVNRF